MEYLGEDWLQQATPKVAILDLVKLNLETALSNKLKEDSYTELTKKSRRSGSEDVDLERQFLVHRTVLSANEVLVIPP